MSLLAENLKYLRDQKGLSQEKMAAAIGISRDRYAAYERIKAGSEPPLELLIRISRFVHISVDLLITVDLRKYPLNKILELEDNRILLPIKVDQTGENIIEIVPHRAKAGYLQSYSDPEFIESLDSITLPFLKAGKYRAFIVEGDSMPPHQDGSYVVGKYVESIDDVKDNTTYVLVTSDGIVYKRVKRVGIDALELISDEKFYEPYTVPLTDVYELWRYSCSIATNEFEPSIERDVKQMFRTIVDGITDIKEIILK